MADTSRWRLGIYGMLFLALTPIHADALTAKDVIQFFYQAYLPETPRAQKTQPTPPFSKSFLTLRAKNIETCKKYAGTDICGWGAEGDPYLDAQDGEDHLTYAKAVRSITEPARGRIRVAVNVFPSQKDNPDVIIEFLMIQISGRWLVDDVITSGSSARKYMLDEIGLYEKQNP